MSLAFGPHRFRSTVPYYAAHRVPYPDGLISFVAERCGLARASRCSTLAAELAIAFARLGWLLRPWILSRICWPRLRKWGASQPG